MSVITKTAVAPLDLSEYEHAATSRNQKFLQFLHLLQTKPEATKVELAGELGVTRQTVHHWTKRIRHNEPVRTRGRQRKFESGPTVGMTVRVPGDLPSLLEQCPDRRVSRPVRRWIDGVIARAYAELVNKGAV